jgi:hypothetical protein
MHWPVDMMHEVTKLFESYLQAFLSNNSETVSDFWAFPAYVSWASGDMAFYTPSQFLAGMNQEMARFNEIGAVKHTSEIMEVRRISDKSALVRTQDTFFHHGKIVPEKSDYFFFVHKFESGWKIVSALIDAQITFLTATDKSA